MKDLLMSVIREPNSRETARTDLIMQFIDTQGSKDFQCTLLQTLFQTQMETKMQSLLLQVFYKRGSFL